MSKEVVKSQTSWPAYLANLTLSTVGGYCIEGVSGGAVAMSATVADEFLISKGYTAKHYLTSTALWSSLVAPIGQGLAEIFPEWSWPIYAASAATVGAFSYYGNEFLNYQEKIDDVTSDLTPMIKLFDDKNILSKKELDKVISTVRTNPIEGLKLAAYDLSHVISNRFILTTAATTMLDLFTVSINTSCNKYIGNDGTTMLALTLMSQNPSDGVPELAYKGVKISSILVAKNLVISFISAVNSYINSNLRLKIDAKSIEQMLLAEEHLTKLIAMKNSLNITTNLNGDLLTIFAMGQCKLRHITTDKMKEFVAFSEVMAIAPESIVIEQVKGFLKKKLSDFMYKKTTEDVQKSIECYAEKQSIISDLSSNFIASVLTHSTGLIKSKYNASISNNKAIEDKKMLWQNLQNISTQILEVLSQFVDILYYGSKIINGQISIEQAPLLLTWLKEVSSLLQGGFKMTITGGAEAQKRILTLLETINSETKEDVAEHSLNDQGKIIIDDYCLKKGDEIMLNIKHLELENKHYAISGKSGLGKSTFLKDVGNCLTDPFNSSGRISLPSSNGKQIKTMFIDQKLYIPAKSTLFEAITLKSLNMLDVDTKSILQEKIISLLQVLMSKECKARNWEDEINNANFDATTLSGGESKKIGIVKAILEQPQILVMDEVFVGLDDESLGIVQNLLCRELPNTTVIVVDHKAAENNQSNFYYAEIHLSQDGHEITYFSEKEVELAGDGY